MSKLEAVSITKSFGDNTILQDVSLRLEPREIVCLLGVSGGGTERRRRGMGAPEGEQRGGRRPPAAAAGAQASRG